MNAVIDRRILGKTAKADVTRPASTKKAETHSGFSTAQRARNADLVLKKYEGVFRALASK